MSRWMLAGCMALAALGAVAVLDVGSATAEAAPSVSPFAGTYVTFDWPVPITISDGGQITSSFSNVGGYTTGSISGRVRADGSYSFTVSGSYEADDPRGHFKYPLIKYSYKSTGNMALDLVGNIVGTEDTGGSFVWLRL